MDLLNLIRTKKHILFDGAMGTELHKRARLSGQGLSLMGVGKNNLVAPEVVLEIHREYARCGCHVLTTNTLTMNRIYIETHDVGVNVEEVNRAGAALARQAAGKDLYVLGDISSTGQLLEPYGNYTESAFYDCFKEQAQVLAEGGVDGFIIETMFDLREALCALRACLAVRQACKDNFKLLVVVSIAFATEKNGGRTIMGNTAEECVRRCAEAGADVVGANCGEIDPTQMASIVSLLRGGTSLPILAQPNAGKPRLADQATVFDMGAADFARGIAECMRAGATLVGGCCGTTPEHIRAVAEMLNNA
jgi:5-methyltetrahydrofolate--homocysteine methyltransferase